MMGKIKKGPFVFCLLIFFILFFYVPESKLYSQNLSQEHRFGKEYLYHLFDDSIRIYSSPVKWDKEDYLRFSAVFGTGLVLFVFDDSIYDWIQDNNTQYLEEVSGFVTDFGHGAFLAGISALLYTTGELSRNDELRMIGLHSFQSWLTTGLFIMGAKFCTGRARPYMDEGAYSFRPFGFSSRNHSFPSGHAASSFAVAAVISEYSGTLVDILCYSVASMVALSRVHLEKHWMSDVFMGSAIGYFIGKKVCDLNDQRDQGRIQVGFDFKRNYAGITLSFSF